MKQAKIAILDMVYLNGGTETLFDPPKLSSTEMMVMVKWQSKLQQWKSDKRCRQQKGERRRKFANASKLISFNAFLYVSSSFFLHFCFQSKQSTRVEVEKNWKRRNQRAKKKFSIKVRPKESRRISFQLKKKSQIYCRQWNDPSLSSPLFCFWT